MTSLTSPRVATQLEAEGVPGVEVLEPQVDVSADALHGLYLQTAAQVGRVRAGGRQAEPEPAGQVGGHQSAALQGVWNVTGLHLCTAHGRVTGSRL